MTAILVIRIVLSALFALLLSTTGGGKLAGSTSSLAIRDSILVPASRWKAIGAFELLVVVLLVAGIWIVSVGVAGSLGVVALMLGAIVTRARAGGAQLRSGVIADSVILLLGVAATILGVLVLRR